MIRAFSALGSDVLLTIVLKSCWQSVALDRMASGVHGAECSGTCPATCQGSCHCAAMNDKSGRCTCYDYCDACEAGFGGQWCEVTKGAHCETLERGWCDTGHCTGGEGSPTMCSDFACLPWCSKCEDGYFFTQKDAQAAAKNGQNVLACTRRCNDYTNACDAWDGNCAPLPMPRGASSHCAVCYSRYWDFGPQPSDLGDESGSCLIGGACTGPQWGLSSGCLSCADGRCGADCTDHCTSQVGNGTSCIRDGCGHPNSCTFMCFFNVINNTVPGPISSERLVQLVPIFLYALQGVMGTGLGTVPYNAGLLKHSFDEVWPAFDKSVGDAIGIGKNELIQALSTVATCVAKRQCHSLCSGTSQCTGCGSSCIKCHGDIRPCTYCDLGMMGARCQTSTQDYQNIKEAAMWYYAKVLAKYGEEKAAAIMKGMIESLGIKLGLSEGMSKCTVELSEIMRTSHESMTEVQAVVDSHGDFAKNNDAISDASYATTAFARSWWAVFHECGGPPDDPSSHVSKMSKANFLDVIKAMDAANRAILVHSLKQIGEGIRSGLPSAMHEGFAPAWMEFVPILAVPSVIVL